MANKTIDRDTAARVVAQTLTISEAAQWAGVSRPTIYKWLEQGLPTMTSGSGATMIYGPDLDSFKATRPSFSPSPSASPSASASPDDGAQGTWKSGTKGE